MVRRFVFAVAVIAGTPLFILAWALDVLATACLMIFGLYWSTMMLVLSREQRRTYADRWSSFAFEWARSNPTSPWGPRIMAFASLAAAMAE